MKSSRTPLYIVGFLIAGLLAACASIGNPTGGPRDELPPRFVRSNPKPGAVNVSRQKIDIEFDEIVNVKDAFTNVIVSPTSESKPRVTSLGRHVTVNFPDTLLSNTTYTIDFGSSIEDNNEANKLQNFAFTFSTGPVLDSLMVSGIVLGAEDLEPRPGILVGVHSNIADSAFVHTRLERIGRTDDRGRFTIRGLAPGTYRVYALGDVDNDYRYANPEEEMAFLDFTVTPETERAATTDTIYNMLTGQVDTVVERMRTLFLPNDLLLRSFISDRRPQYLSKYERLDSTRISLVFNTMADTLPLFGIAGNERYSADRSDWYVVERSAHNDTITYWLTDPDVIATDTLYLALGYLRTDTAQKLSMYNDTLRLLTNRPRVVKKKSEKKKMSEKDSIAAVMSRITLPLKVLSGSTQEVYNPIVFEFDAPLIHLDTAAFHIEQKIDTLWTPLRGDWRLERVDSLSPRRFRIEYPWAYGTQYRLTADSLAATGIYGRVTMPLSHEFKTRAEEDYSALTFNITGFTDTVPAFVELLNTSDKPVRAAILDDTGTVVFRHLQPGKYYARIYEDFNGNRRYDTGDFDSLRQPDQVYYYPKVVNLKKNWEKTETWDVFATSVDMQKPDNLKKNKPEADKKRRNNRTTEEEEDDEEEQFDPFANPFAPDNSRNRDRNRR